MKVFVVVTDPELVREFFERTTIKLNVMISYHYLRGNAQKLVVTYRNKINLLYLDSGAFSANQGRSQITLSEYSGYLQMFGRSYDAVFNFDNSFADPDHNLINQVTLENNLKGTGIRAIPVIHDPQDPLGEFKLYADDGHDYIAIGSDKTLPNEILQKIKTEFPNIRVHMFGTLARKMLFTFKPYSADSSVYAQKVKVGELSYWDPIDKKEYHHDIGDRDTNRPNHVKRFHHYDQLEIFWRDTFGYDYQTLLNNTTAKSIVNLYFLWQLENRVNEVE
jgi:hypothetical protein